MTSIIGPIPYAIDMATQAQAKLAAASASLQAPPVHKIGIPEHSGPDTPDNPWFRARPDGRPMSEAAHLAGQAIQHIDAALALRNPGSLSDTAFEAFGRAREEAVKGVSLLQSRPAHHAPASTRFDGAGLWLGLAKSFLALEGDARPPIAPRPPITIGPKPPRITIPSPVSDIQ